MTTNSSVRPIVWLGACLLALMGGVLIGLKMAGPGADAVQMGDGLPLDSSKSDQRGALQSPVTAGGVSSELVDDWDGVEEAVSPEMADLDEFLKMGQMDPIRAAEEALNATNDLERISKLALLLSQAQGEDMPAIAELISSNRGNYDRMQQMGMLYYAWGQVDAPAAVAYAESQGGRQSGMATAVALSSWASSDPANARAWVDGQENPSRYQRGLLLGWSETKPLQALQYISQQEDDGDLMNRWVAPQIARNLVAQRGVMAIDDLAAMPSSKNRQALLQRLADELGETQPEAAAVRLSSINDPEILMTAVPEVAQEWARNDPQAAVAFVSEYQDNSQVYSRAMAEAIEEWAERDPFEAGKYLNEQPASPELDRSVAEYSREVAGVDPVGAMSFAVSVNDARLRADTIRRVARDWKKSSADDYNAWAKENPELAPKSSDSRARE